MASRRSMSIAALAVTLCIVGGLLLALNPYLFGNGLEWSITIGTKLSFAISCSLDVDNGSSWPIDEVIYEVLSLNGTTVIANVTFLPDVRYAETADDFATNVIECLKVDVQFPNDTSSSAASTVTLLISKSLLPTSNWEFIDALFTDYNVHWSPGGHQWEYLSRAGNGTFVISHWGQELHGAKGWVANVTMITGCPRSIYWFDYRVHDYPPYLGYHFQFTLRPISL